MFPNLLITHSIVFEWCRLILPSIMANEYSQGFGDEESITAENNSLQESITADNNSLEHTHSAATNTSASSSTIPNPLPISNAQFRSLVEETINEAKVSFLKGMEEKFVPLKRRARTYEDYNQASTSSGKRHHGNNKEYLRAQRPSKRQRSPSTDRDYFQEEDLSENYSEEYDYDTEDDCSESESDGQEPEEVFLQDRHRVINTQANGGPGNKRADCEPVFHFMGEMYTRLDDSVHKLVDHNKILWGEEIVDVKWHPTKAAFCLTKKENKPHEHIYIDPEVGHQAVTSLFSLGHNITVKPLMNRKCFDSTLNSGSGLGKFIHIMMSTQGDVLYNLGSKDEEAARNAIPDKVFETVSMANFTTGWPANSPYIAWAKGETLNIDKAGRDLELEEQARVYKDDLEDEKIKRYRVTNQFTGFKMIDLLIDNFKNEPGIVSAILQIAHQFLPTLRDLTFEWMVAKYEIRKTLLLGASNLAANPGNPTVRQLLQSNMWDPEVFPQDLLTKLRSDGPSKSILAMIKPYPTESKTSRSQRYRRYNQGGAKRRRFEKSFREYNENQGRQSYRRTKDNRNTSKKRNRQSTSSSNKDKEGRTTPKGNRNSQAPKASQYNNRKRDSSSQKSKAKRRDRK